MKKTLYSKTVNYLTLIRRKAHHPQKAIANRVRLLFKDKANHKFLFVLSPPYCGSTLLTQLISSSKSVSINNLVGAREGQLLPGVIKLMYKNDRRWDPTLSFDWEMIKKVWIKYWDLTKPVLLEKSPPSIVRAKDIEKVFQPCQFIIFCRNPYAHCESLIRRNNSKAKDAAEFAIMCLTFQKSNLDSLSNYLFISYEEMTDHPLKTLDKMIDFLPELADMRVEQEFNAHNFKGRSLHIQNLNKEKIEKLTKQQLQEINVVFCNHKELLEGFGYELLPNP